MFNKRFGLTVYKLQPFFSRSPIFGASMGLGQLSGKHVLCPLLLSEVKEILVQMSKALIGLKQKLCVWERESKKSVRFYKRMDELFSYNTRPERALQKLRCTITDSFPWLRQPTSQYLTMIRSLSRRQEWMEIQSLGETSWKHLVCRLHRNHVKPSQFWEVKNSLWTN